MFCTQVAGNPEYTSQATREELIGKLSKRLRNLVYVFKANSYDYVTLFLSFYLMKIMRMFNADFLNVY